MIRRGFIIIALFTLPCHALAGAWTQGARNWEVTFQHVYYQSSEFADRKGNTQQQPRFEKFELNPYIEYGLSDSLTLGLNAFAHRVSQSGISAETNYGLADTELFARQRLWHNAAGYVVSVQPLVKLPSFYMHKGIPRGGSEDWNTELRLQGGRGFTWLGQPHFVSLEAAYRYRDGPLHDQLLLVAKSGFRITNCWMITPALSTTLSTRLSSSAAFSEDGQQDYDLFKGELTASYDWSEQLRLHAGAFSHLAGRNAGLGNGLIFGAMVRF